MADETISQLTQIAAPPFSSAFTNPSTGAMLEILDTTTTTMAPTGTNSKIAPGDLIKGYLAAGSNVTLTETSGIVTIAASGGGGLPGGATNGQVLTEVAGAPAWANPVTANSQFGYLTSIPYAVTSVNPSYANVGVSITLPSLGTYFILGITNAQMNLNGTVPNYGFISVQINDTTNSIVVPGSISNVIQDNLQITGSTINFQSTSPIAGILYSPTTAPATLQLQACYQTNCTTFTFDLYGATTLVAIRIA